MEQKVELDSDQEPLLSLLRTKGVSIRDLDEAKKNQLREFMQYLHVIKGLSLTDIAKLIGNKSSGYTSWLCKQLGVRARPFEEARLKGIKEKRRKYERNPFDGTDEDRAYLLGLRHGDLSVSKPWKDVVRVSTSTTHPAMAELFRSLFEPFGHVYQHPRYKKETQSYEWNLSTILDSSFDFLLQELSDVEEWVASSRDISLSYLSGLLDAEGSFITTKDNRGLTTVFVDYYNSDKRLIDWVNEVIERMGFHCSLRINKKKGVRTKKYGIIHRNDYWQLSTYGKETVQNFVRLLTPKHAEKIRRKEMALKVTIGQPFSTYEAEISALRLAIKTEVIQFVKEAEQQFLARHSGFGTAPQGESD